MANEAAVEAGKPKETPKFLDCSRCWPGNYCLNLRWVCRHPLSTDDMAQIRNLSLRELALGELDVSLILG